MDEYLGYYIMLIVYMIMILPAFVIAKLKFKVNFTYEKVLGMSILGALISYFGVFAYILAVVGLPDTEYMDIFIYATIGEIIGFLIATLLLTLVVYATGRTIHKSMKSSKTKKSE